MKIEAIDAASVQALEARRSPSRRRARSNARRSARAGLAGRALRAPGGRVPRAQRHADQGRRRRSCSSRSQTRRRNSWPPTSQANRDNVSKGELGKLEDAATSARPACRWRWQVKARARSARWPTQRHGLDDDLSDELRGFRGRANRMGFEQQPRRRCARRSPKLRILKSRKPPRTAASSTLQQLQEAGVTRRSETCSPSSIEDSGVQILHGMQGRDRAPPPRRSRRWAP